ncbi:MAG: ABC transporter ATP-binding protein [Phycisphaeraceae bacterium]|nr:ABC transporter ATP-binding protein [Phycisphaeraceae bacterium]
MPTLTLDSLCKSFGSLRAVDGVSLEIRPGECFGLLGPNGAGKSTTIAMIMGVLRPDSGSVTLEGAGDTSAAQARRAIGLAPQALALYDELSAQENLEFFGRLYGVTGAALNKRVDELLRFVDLHDRRRSRVKTYSGGMKRRLNLAAGLVHDPDILLCDEPTVGVDPQSRNAIFDIVESLKAGGKTVLYTTHYMEEAQRLCDRVAIIDHGRILAIDRVDSLIRDHGGQSEVVFTRRGHTEITERTDEPLATIRTIVAHDDIERLHIRRPSLEAVFLNLTGRTLRD